jgi:phosphatidylglycerophosphatase A
MKAAADSQTSSAPAQQDASPATSTAATTRKPRFALFIATAGGLGYLPKAPGTWGSLAGVLICALTQFYFPLDSVPGTHLGIGVRAFWTSLTALPIAILIAGVGVWASSSAAKYSRRKDPQFVVIDEVSGQHLTYLLALSPLSWKYLLLGFILFRLFDIWKPFPARQAESLPGGWGIMADDWIAAIYAAIGLWIARAAGL